MNAAWLRSSLAERVFEGNHRAIQFNGPKAVAKQAILSYKPSVTRLVSAPRESKSKNPIQESPDATRIQFQIHICAELTVVYSCVFLCRQSICMSCMAMRGELLQ